MEGLPFCNVHKVHEVQRIPYLLLEFEGSEDLNGKLLLLCG